MGNFPWSLFRLLYQLITSYGQTPMNSFYALQEVVGVHGSPFRTNSVANASLRDEVTLREVARKRMRSKVPH